MSAKTIIIPIVIAIVGIILIGTFVSSPKPSVEPIELGATVCFPYQGCTGQDTSDWTGYAYVTSGTWGTSSAAASANWTLKTSNAITPTTTVGIIVNASSTFVATTTVGGFTDGTMKIITGTISGASGNISQWTNDTGYVTVGSNWQVVTANALSPTSTVGFIMNASSTVNSTLTVSATTTVGGFSDGTLKISSGSVSGATGNVSMWTNDSGYLTTSDWATTSADYWITTKTTDNLTQGSSNLYYSTQLFATDLAGTTTDALSQGSTNLYYSTQLFATDLAGTTTDALSQGSTNQYYSTQLFATDMAGTTTDALSEGSTNLYYTTSRDRTSNWLLKTTNALAPTSTVGVIVSASSTIAGNLALHGGDITLDNAKRLYIRNNAGTVSNLIFADAGDDVYVGSSDLDRMFLVDTSGVVITLDAAGKVGISTTSPDVLLHVGDTVPSHLSGAEDVMISGGIEVDGASYIDDILTVTGIIATDSTTTGSMIIPQGASPTVDEVGEMAIDTTSGQLIYYDGTAKRVITYEEEGTIIIASSTLMNWGSYGATGTTTVELGAPRKAETWIYVYCYVDTGTTTIKTGDGTNWDTMVCNPSGLEYDSNTLANSSFTAREKRQLQVGSQLGDPNRLIITVTKTVDPD